MAQGVIQAGQSLMDMAVEHYGTWEAAIDIAFATDISLTDTPELNRLYPLPEKVYNRVMQAHCKSIGVSPATLHDHTGVRWSIFSAPFNSVFR